MKKKIILAILTGILTTGILSACGDNAQEKIEISESATETYILKQPTTEAESAVETENSDNAQASVAETEEESPQENTSASDDLVQSYINSITLETAEQKGVCGNDLIWFYKDNVLVIRGTGPMTDYDSVDYTPWSELKEDIQWVIIDNGCTHIGGNCFAYTPLSKAVLPDSLQSIGENAFHYCDSLTEIDLPDSVQSIGRKAFFACTSLTEINLSDSLQLIEADAFSNCESLTEIDLPDSLQSIGERAFFCCYSLTEIDFSDSLQSIEASAFAFCKSLTEINLPDSLQYIGPGAFYECKLNEEFISKLISDYGYEQYDE